MKDIKNIGEKLITISTLLLCISIPTSIFLDNLAAGIGLLGLLILLISKEKDWPSIKPFFLLLIPELVSIIINKHLSKFDIDIKLVPYFSVYKSFKSEKIVKVGIILLSISTTLLCFSILFEAFTWINIKKYFSYLFNNQIYLYYLTHHGILGLLGYLLFWCYFIFLNLKNFQKTHNHIYLYFILSYLGFLVAGFFENNFLDAEVKFATMFFLGFNYLTYKASQSFGGSI